MSEHPVLMELRPSDSIPLTRTLRVLCVDDNRDAADTLGELLRLLGAEAEVYYDGPTALEMVSRFCPHVCLLDLSMPVMDGFQLATHLLDWTGNHPLLLVAVTARSDYETRQRTKAVGFDLHLIKPVDPRDLIALLADAEWWLHDRLPP